MSPSCAVNETSTELGCIPNTVSGFVSKFYGIGLGLIGGVAILFIIYGGYILMTSQGRPDKISNGKSYITYAIIGLLLAIFGYIFIQVIAIDILHIPGFS
jgi:glucose uptake protein GlcU